MSQEQEKSATTTFEPLVRLSGKVAVLPGANTDTDQIIPARFLKKDRAQGYGQYLFHDARFDEQGNARQHPLNVETWNRPVILCVQDNFGCGSSREGAVYALVDYGIKAVVGTTFGDIFYNNCFKNGLLPVKLTPSDHQRLSRALAAMGGGALMTVDLESCTVSCGSESAGFEVDDFWRECLMKGLDEVSLTLSYEDQIGAFEDSYGKQFPWLRRNVKASD